HSANFGFEALGQRHHALLGSPMQLPPVEARFDLTGYLKQRLGANFVPHPHLHSLIALNEVGGRDYLNPEQTAAAWRRGEWVNVARSLEAKAGAIVCLYRLLWEGKLQTDLGAVSLDNQPQETPKISKRKQRGPDPELTARDR